MLTAKELDAKFRVQNFDAEISMMYAPTIKEMKKEYKPLLSSNGLLHKIFKLKTRHHGTTIKLIREAETKKEYAEYREMKIDSDVLTDDIIFDHIVNVVCSLFNLQFTDLQVQSRKRGIIVPRSMIIFFTRWLTKIPLKSIALKVSSPEVKKDHSTILSSCKAVWTAYEIQDQEMYPHIIQAQELLNKLQGIAIDFNNPPKNFETILKNRK